MSAPTPEAALAAIRARAEPGRAEQMAAYHKADRPYLGVPNPDLDALSRDWRRAVPAPERVALADALWRTNIHEARVAAAKLLTQARIRPDDHDVWALLCSWLPDFDAWAIADHACMAMQRRLTADPTRLDIVEGWTGSDHLWTRRAALVATLPWTKMTHPSAEDLARRDRILSWAAGYVTDKTWFIQKAVAWWLRDLSKHDPDRVRRFLDRHGPDMKAFARREAGKYLGPPGD
ncbi:3-methyladenine DNA glycosylase AlkD [Cribrihabitans marinus]|uniref:3-methyladenine DNA glycosylase AlkD n=1 Tax=Cribrihabitans marinus TaxID=1227549 RepID=A0A1H6TVL7_9RHOB|nr:DNA alkylation repair protein [Cribrihabitans marinus]GGH21684.1 DNA alkylation repair protein [Cribrihabitans marinus]SEI80320.1 3-methyladenine DNA glycosylase AlkD [Cribrihabitans marinus]